MADGSAGWFMSSRTATAWCWVETWILAGAREPIHRRKHRSDINVGTVIVPLFVPAAAADLSGQLDVAVAQPADAVRPQTHSHALVPQVDIGVMIRDVGQPADRVHQRGGSG